MMATPKELAVRQAATARKAFEAVAMDSTAPHIAIAAALEDFRVASHTAILDNFEASISNEIEEQLWVAHGHVNNRYRARIDKMRREGKHRVVEIRKLAKQYLDFIKSSQRFYRDYILQLDQRFGGIEELQKIAPMWKQQGTAMSSSTTVLSPQIKRKAILSCYHTLIHLGDLSRYRASKLDDPEKRNWGPAVGYYGLAGEIWPESGISHNQRAMIAVETGNHLSTIYHFYRALSVEKPHPLAKDNLEKEFKRIITAWDKGELIKTGSKDGNSGAGSALIAWFVRLHSKCYKGEQFTGHDELEKEVLGQLTTEIKDRSLETTMVKFIIINVAAEDFSSARLQDAPTESSYKSYSSFLRLNARTFHSLLRLLLSELRQQAGQQGESGNVSRSALGDRITVVARRTLPGLRLYSSWFTKNWAILAAEIADESLRASIQELWRCYADMLTTLATLFPAELLPSIDYMLEEDAEAIGFKPLMSKLTRWIWYTGQDLRPRFSDSKVERSHPNDEMLVRIRDLLVNGLELAARTDDAPLSLSGVRFVYADPNSAPGDQTTTPSNLPSAPVAQPQKLPDIAERSETPKIKHTQAAETDTIIPEHTDSRPLLSAAPTILAEDLDMNRMVDDLVGSEDGVEHFGEDNMPPTPPEQTFDDTTLVNDSTYGLPSLSVVDSVTMAQTFTPKSATSNPSSALFPTRPSLSPPPPIRQLPAIPLLPDQSSIWGVGGESASNPASPFLHHATGSIESPPHFSNMTRSHSRQHSGHSSRGSIDPWNTSYTVAPSSSLEQQGFPGSANRRMIAPFGGNMTTPSNNFSHPAHYGSPWGSDLGSPMRRTPPNGQGG